MYACVIGQHGKKLFHRNFKTRNADKFFQQIEPFGPNIAISCESTFNWYWLADACHEKGLPFILGHALYLKAIHGGKVKNDKLDSEKLALLLRGGNFATAYVYPKQLRATRDLMRRRTHLVRLKAQTITHLQIVNHQHNFDPHQKKITYFLPPYRYGLLDLKGHIDVIPRCYSSDQSTSFSISNSFE